MTQDFRQIAGGPRTESRAGFGRIDPEAPVVRRQVGLGEVAVGVLEGADANGNRSRGYVVVGR
jgi:hypothetical protein